ncbi:MAG: TldD/PmbA family protein [Bacillota bacterium]|nr:TldD/PmbA family protein [Bacillota bacterium]
MISDIVSSLSGSFAPGAHSELRAQKSLDRRVVLLNGSLVGNTRQDSQGVSARVYQNGVYGFASAADLSAEAAKKALLTASQNAAFLNEKTNPGKGPLPQIMRGVLPAQKDFKDVEQKRYLDFVTAIDQYIVEKYPDLASRTIVATADSMEKQILTSDGYQAHTLAPRAYIYVMMSSQTRDGMPVEVFKPFGKSGTFEDNFTDPALLYGGIDQLYEHLMKKREGVFAEAGVKTVILSGELSGILAHEAVGHTVEGDLVLGGSVAGPNLNQMVASPLVSMTDFAHTAFGETAPLPVYVDDEGVLAEDAELIRNGKLVGYMLNRELGRHFNMQPRGNARAFAFNDEPLIRMRNTAIHAGPNKLADMIANTEDGYYLISTNNGQADTTGEFMFGVTVGYEIKNGKLGRGLFDTTISGVAFDMLKTVDMVSDTVTWGSSGFCGKKQPMPVGIGGPELRCKVMVGGK